MPSHPFDAITAAQLRAAGSLKWTAYPDQLGAWIAEADFGTAPAVTRALHQAVDAPLLGYLPEGPRRELTEACAAWHEARYGWSVDPAWIHPITDGLTGLQIAMQYYCDPAGALIVPTPAYMPFLSLPRRLRREVIQVPSLGPEHGWALDLAGIARAFRAGGSLLVLCNPHNPTGRVYTHTELAALAVVVEAHGGSVLSDEIWAPLTYPGAVHVPYASLGPTTAGHTITVTSAAKAWNIPGAKCAQVILSNERDAATWAEWDIGGLRPASTLGVVANTAAYREGGAFVAEVVDYLAGNRELVTTMLGEVLPAAGYREPEATYLAWIDATPLLPEQSAADWKRYDLAARVRRLGGVAMQDGRACGEVGRGHLRFNFAMPRPLLREALEGLARALG